jgi:hypothetical protein
VHRQPQVRAEPDYDQVFISLLRLIVPTPRVESLKEEGPVGYCLLVLFYWFLLPISPVKKNKLEIHGIACIRASLNSR